MNRKILTRLLSVLLVVVMTFGLMPVSASAAWWWPWSNDETQDQPTVAEQAATDNSDFIRVFHLDCGRKYFTVAEVEKIIDQLAANYYTHLELAFGNEGLRFIPDADKMAVGSYTGEQVVAALAKGNQSYDSDQRLSYTTDAWSEAEMTQIISYANGKGIKIIPMFDIPGHMNAVIAAMQELGISVSVFSQVGYNYPGNIGQSFDPTNAAAAAFAKGLVENYIAYFKDKCKYFNIAGDECGFSKMNNTQYTAYVDLMNALNTTVKANGMTTMMFNDGVYYKNKNATNPLSTDIVICYWTGGNNYATSPELANKGFTLLNTNTHWYYVAGKESGNAQFYYDYALNAMKTKKCNVCDGGGQTTDFGCMLAFWCDDPGAAVNKDNLYNYIAQLANNNPTYFKETETLKLTIMSSSTTGALKVGESLTLTANMAANWSTEGAGVVDLTSDANGLSTVVTARSAGTATIKAAAQSDASKTASYTVTVTDNDEPGVTDTVPIEMTVGDDPVTKEQTGEKAKATTEDTSIATVDVNAQPEKNGWKKASSITSGDSYYIYDETSGNYLILSDGNVRYTTNRSEATKWTITKSSNSGSTSYTIKSGDYLLTHKYYTQYGYILSVDRYQYEYDDNMWKFDAASGFYYTVRWYGVTSNYYLRFNNVGNSQGWQVSTTTTNKGYPYTGETKPASTTITFTPVAEGTTEIIVGTTKYKITVYAKKVNVGVHLTPGDEYDLTKDITIPTDGTVTFETVSASGVDVDKSTGKLTNTVDGGEAKVTATVKNKAGRTTTIYTFTITVSKEDLSNAPKLPIQLWITNQTIQSDNSEETTGTFLSGWGDKVQYIALDASTIPGVNSSNGVALSACVPELITNRYQYNTTYWKSIHASAGEENKIPYNFLLWKGKVLNSTTGLQLSGNGVSKINATETGKINDFTFVRYLDDKWEVSPDQKQWREVTGSGSTGSSSTCTEQIIAYYYMQTKLTDEVTTNIVDWGKTYENVSDNPYVVLDFTVKLETGNYDPLPSAFPIKGRTYGYHCNGKSDTCGTQNGVRYRRIDQIEATKADNYEIYMITLTPTSDTASEELDHSTAQSIPEGSDIYKGTEKVVWVNTVEDLSKAGFNDESLYYTSPSGETFDPDDTTGKYVGGKAELSSVEIYQNQGLLITYYVRSKAEHEIRVHYIDKLKDYDFLTIGISVAEDTYFSSNFGMNADGTLHDNTVANVNGKTETVLSDLKLLPTVPAEYRRVSYTLAETKLDPATNATDVYLYYTFDNSAAFIADFGLPMTITPTQVNTNLQGAAITDAKATVSSGVPLTVDTANPNAIVITPTKDFAAAKSGVSFTLEYTGTKAGETTQATVGYRITVIPASNVLYEENFLTTTDTTNWKMTPAGITSAQQLQKANDDKTYNVFGYDDAYKSSADENGVWKATGLTTTAATGDLTADFYGNGFDLIGNCGLTTGKVMMVIAKKGTNKGVAGVLIDTRYKEDIYQVPLAHIMLPKESEYTAVIRATGLKAETVSTQAAAVYAAPSAADVNDVFADMLAEYGLSSADVEYIGGEQIASSPIAVQRAPAIAAYATIERKDAGDHVEIAGFRVYRSTTGTVAANYPAAEQNLTYENIIDLLDGKTITATVEGGSVVSCTPTEYEKKGGPQNEIYLANNQSIVFGVSSPNTIQVSLRAVKNATSWNNGSGTAAEIGSITEMYYNVTPVAQDDGTYTVTILNTGNDLLAIGNVKVPSGVTTQSASELSDDVILASVRAAYAGMPEPVEETFTPDTFKAHATSMRLFRNKVVTLNISVSKDVAYVTVNGKTYTPSKFFSRWMKTATILVTDTIGRNESKTYTIIAYNSDGVASDPIVVKG